MSGVLVIEDDDRIRRSLMMALEDEGYKVRGTATAEEGLAAHRAEPAEAVLVDLMLPGIDGFECVRQLRRDGDATIVVVSARDDTHDIVAALEAGADDYLVKPVAIKELSARMRAVRRRTRGGPARMPVGLAGGVMIGRGAETVGRCGSEARGGGGSRRTIVSSA